MNISLGKNTKSLGMHTGDPETYITQLRLSYRAGSGLTRSSQWREERPWTARELPHFPLSWHHEMLLIHIREGEETSTQNIGQSGLWPLFLKIKPVKENES